MHSANGYQNEDVGNILSLEHVNVKVPDQSKATLFYVVGLGFTRDPHMMVGLNNMWINLGEQQCHLPTGDPLVLRGHVGLVMPDIEALKGRLASVADGLAGTKFAWSQEDGYVKAICPWGNEYRCYAPAPRFGTMRRGMPYVEFNVERGAAGPIAEFYRQALGAPSRTETEASGQVARVDVGVNQQLSFREVDGPLPAFDGHHIQIYILNFSGPFAYMSERGLISEDVRNHQFRFENIVDPETNKVVFTVEHEVRSARHGLFRRQLVNRSLDELAVPTAVPVLA